MALNKHLAADEGYMEDSAHDGDSGTRALARLGIKQELKRDFNMFTSFALSFSIISILTGITGERYEGIIHQVAVFTCVVWAISCREIWPYSQVSNRTSNVS